MRQPRIFPQFPQTTNPVTLCPVCGTNEQAPCVLVPIEGQTKMTQECLCVHVNCAIATTITRTAEELGTAPPGSAYANVRMLYTTTNDPT